MPDVSPTIFQRSSQLAVTLAATALPQMAQAADASVLYKTYEAVGSGMTLLPYAAVGIGFLANPLFRGLDFHGKRLARKLTAENRDTENLETWKGRFYKFNFAVLGAATLAVLMAGHAASHGHFEAAVAISGAVILGEAAVACVQSQVKSYLARRARQFADEDQKTMMISHWTERVKSIQAALNGSIAAWRGLSVSERAKMGLTDLAFTDLVSMSEDIAGWSAEIRGMKYADELVRAEREFTERLKTASESVVGFTEKMKISPSTSDRKGVQVIRQEVA